MLPATARLVSVPTLVSEDASTFAASVAPVSVPAAATDAMVMFAVPSNATPLIVRAVASAVAVPALPVMVEIVRFALRALPLIVRVTGTYAARSAGCVAVSAFAPCAAVA